MTITSALAAQNYTATRPFTEPADGDGKATRIGDFAAEFIGQMRGAETVAMQSMTGEADPHALVQALAQTELAVDAAVTIRDRVVEAYQEIMRMPV